MATGVQLVNEELDLFNPDPAQTQMRDRTTEKIPPLSSDFNSSTKITFDILNEKQQQYLDPSSVRLFVELAIQKWDATNSKWIPIAKDDKIFPINNCLHSLFRDFEVELKGTIINENNGTYPYLAYLNNLLTYGLTVLETQGTSFGWELDDA